VPVRVHVNPTRRLAFTPGTRESRVPRIPNAPKVEVELQHVKLFVSQSCAGMGLVLRTGVAEAVTLLAKAMAATRETRGLWNSIVKTV